LHLGAQDKRKENKSNAWVQTP